MDLLIEDVFPIKNGDFPASYDSLLEGKLNSNVHTLVVPTSGIPNPCPIRDRDAFTTGLFFPEDS